MTKPLEERFWEKVDRRGPDECWLWTGGRFSSGGYGGIRASAPDKRTLRAHCYSFELHGGTIAPGVMVLHSCDTPLCVNPRHLSAGTHQDNMDGMVERERQCTSLAHPATKLTDDQVARMRQEYVRFSPGFGHKALGAKYGVSTTHAGRIIRGERR